MDITTVIVIVWLVLWCTRRPDCPPVVIVREWEPPIIPAETWPEGPQTREEAARKHTCKIPGCAGLHRSHP